MGGACLVRYHKKAPMTRTRVTGFSCLIVFVVFVCLFVCLFVLEVLAVRLSWAAATAVQQPAQCHMGGASEHE